MKHSNNIHQRFRGFLPVVVDIETSGMDPNNHAILEIGMVFIELNKEHGFKIQDVHFEHILPFKNALLDPKSLEFNKIDPYQPLRFAISEYDALKKLFALVDEQLTLKKCKRAVLVGHNAWFDLLFLKAAAMRNNIDFPFHAFTCFDTATLSGAIYGQTVLAKAMHCAKIDFNTNEAHSALYDANKTAELFCKIMNTVSDLD